MPPQYYAPFDFSFSLSPLFGIFLPFSRPFYLFTRPKERRENYVFNGYLCPVTCIVLIDVRQKRYSRLFLSLFFILLFFLLNAKRWQDRVTSREQGNSLFRRLHILIKNCSSRSTPMERAYYRVVAGKYVVAMVFREACGDRAEGVLFQKKMHYHIF